MSILEGILTKLIEINLSSAKQYFPKNKRGQQKKLEDLVFDEKIAIAKKLKFIEKEYYEIFQKMKNFRNYMHPYTELKGGEKIDLGASQISLGILNHILNTLGELRFIQGQVWNVVSGEPVYESSSDTIDFRRGNTRTDSFIVTKGFLGKNINISFDLVLSNSGLLNLVYNHEQDSTFNMLRFDGRNENDNGFLFCKHYAEWDYVEKFKYKLKINIPNKIVINCTTKEFILKINDEEIKFTDNKYPKFNRNLPIGFFNELASLTVKKLKIG
ncbi:MAG: hypothetical protein A2784_01775 [Candidatus Chisholmbacteria bacterium RIFCSPHIGHO2_01_FULL_48_12]|nr:MAG: hypothetical protein A2784_01775 [Candidatus Chisholmbacteria bacterium RIFCSPHIGHO2_01_FULL_48_12]